MPSALLDCIFTPAETETPIELVRLKSGTVGGVLRRSETRDGRKLVKYQRAYLDRRTGEVGSWGETLWTFADEIVEVLN